MLSFLIDFASTALFVTALIALPVSLLVLLALPLSRWVFSVESEEVKDRFVIYSTIAGVSGMITYALSDVSQFATVFEYGVIKNATLGTTLGVFAGILLLTFLMHVFKEVITI